MGNTKSFRMSDKIENMFNSIKKHYLRSASDTELLFAAIERIFEDGTLRHNTYYREQVEKFINDNRTKELFRKICDLLEVLSFSDGYYLEDEVICFLTEEVGDYFFEGYEELESGEPSDNNAVRDFVNRLYTLVLGREAEEKGLESWTNALAWEISVT